MSRLVLIPICNRSETRKQAADSAVARQGAVDKVSVLLRIGISPEQIKTPIRLLDDDRSDSTGRGGYSPEISAAQYQVATKVSKATETRHLTDLFAKGGLVRLHGGGRSCRYQVNGAFQSKTP